MRPNVFAAFLTAALLMPGAAALADPPWERGHEYEAGGCKYEYKAGPNGFKRNTSATGARVTLEGPRPGRQRTAGVASTTDITRLAM